MYRKNYRKVQILLVFIFLLLMAGSAYADDNPTPQHSDIGWKVSYFNNRTLSGDPVLVGSDLEINWDWGPGTPNAHVPVDRFSIRWTRYFDLTAGTYRFTATSDDGIRVSVDNTIVINQWNDHPVQTFSTDIYLAAGHHQVVVEYYENIGDAVAKVSMIPVPVTSNGWLGEYFNNPWLSGSPAYIQDDQNIQFSWGNGSPAYLPADFFSVRWTRTIPFETGTYRFTTTTDDGVRLWVNDHLLIDRWQAQAVTSYSNNIYLSGNASIKMEYYEQAGVASAKLSWMRVDNIPPTPPSPPPSSGTVIVDNGDAGFVAGGSSRAWRTAVEGYNGGILWTWNNDKLRANYNWGRWYPNLVNRRYEVFVYIPERYSTTGNARYWVSHQGGYTLREVDQSLYSGRWVSLGTYWFRGNGDDYVSLADITYETYVSRLIAFDAVKWEPR